MTLACKKWFLHCGAATFTQVKDPNTPPIIVHVEFYPAQTWFPYFLSLLWDFYKFFNFFYSGSYSETGKHSWVSVYLCLSQYSFSGIWKSTDPSHKGKLNWTTCIFVQIRSGPSFRLHINCDLPLLCEMNVMLLKTCLSLNIAGI